MTNREEESSASSASHTAGLGQEAGCYLPVNGKSGREINCRLLESDVSDYPGPPLSVCSLSPLCTLPVIDSSSEIARSDRPNRIKNRIIRPLDEMRVRSGKNKPSVAVNGYTVSESISNTVGDNCAPPSADQPKFEITPGKEKSARGVIGRKSRRQIQVWCYPGKGTPNAPRPALAAPTLVGITPTGKNEMQNLEMRINRDNVPIVPLLSSITENQCELQPFPERVGTVNASDKNSINFAR